MLSRIIRFIGIITIIFFCAFSVFYAISGRTVHNLAISKVPPYSVFLESRFYDMRFSRMIDKTSVSKDIVLAAIDEKSLRELGRWPWSRSKMSALVSKLKDFGAKVISFDVIFSEPEVACNIESPDKLFGKTISDFQNNGERGVVLPFALMDPRNRQEVEEEFPEQLYFNITNGEPHPNTEMKAVARSSFPVPELANADPSFGHISMIEDLDGIFRHYPLYSNVLSDVNDPQSGLLLPSLGLATYQAFTGDKPISTVVADMSHFQSPAFGEKIFEINPFGETLIWWRGGFDKFPIVSIADIVTTPANDQEMINKIKDKIVFIGSIAFAAHDLRHTPIDSSLPGVFTHMNAVDMMINKRFFKPLEESAKISWALLLGGTILLLIIQLFGNALYDIVALGSLMVSMFLYDYYVLIPQGHQIMLFFCLFSVFATYSWNTLFNFYLTAREKKKIRGTFSRYVAPAIVNQMLENPDKLKVGGEKKNITVIFSDVRDFTSISEKLTPAELSSLLNQYMGKMTDILFDTYGTLDKYIGDALVGYWGAPLSLENHAYHALRGAIQMTDTLPSINEQFKEQGFPEIAVGIGLNTGDCSVGNMGSDKIFSYTALGDNMNLGSRLEGLCKVYKTQILCSEYTIDALHDDLKDEIKYRPLDLVRVKGKEKAVEIYEVLHTTHPFQDPAALSNYKRIYANYKEKKFQEALNLLTILIKDFPDDPACIRLQENCQKYLENPPPADWDGVTTYETK